MRHAPVCIPGMRVLELHHQNGPKISKGEMREIYTNTKLKHCKILSVARGVVAATCLTEFESVD